MEQDPFILELGGLERDFHSPRSSVRRLMLPIVSSSWLTPSRGRAWSGHAGLGRDRADQAQAGKEPALEVVGRVVVVEW